MNQELLNAVACVLSSFGSNPELTNFIKQQDPNEAVALMFGVMCGSDKHEIEQMVRNQLTADAIRQKIVEMLKHRFQPETNQLKQIVEDQSKKIQDYREEISKQRSRANDWDERYQKLLDQNKALIEHQQSQDQILKQSLQYNVYLSKKMELQGMQGKPVLDPASELTTERSTYLRDFDRLKRTIFNSDHYAAEQKSIILTYLKRGIPAKEIEKIATAALSAGELDLALQPLLSRKQPETSDER